METWLNEARDALMRRRSRMHTHGVKDAQPVQQQVVVLSEDERQELSDIEEALKRIQNGMFGWCTQCGGAIGRHRLRAVPETRYCLACSARVRASAETVQGGLRREPSC